MRVFYRSAPVFMALSVALAGCGESNPGTSSSAGSGSALASSATTAPSASTDVCLTVEGMT